MIPQEVIDKLARDVYQEWREKEGPLLNLEEIYNIEKGKDEIFNLLSGNEQLLRKIDYLTSAYAEIYEKHGFDAGFLLGLKLGIVSIKNFPYCNLDKNT